jgi:glycosyltransferase 2 family protein
VACYQKENILFKSLEIGKIQKVFIGKKAMILMKWKRIRKIIPFIGVALFIYLLIRLDVTKVIQQIENVNFLYIALALASTFIFFITQTIKWFVIARKQKITIPFKDAFKINLISSFYGFVTPSKIGSVMRIDYLSRYNGNTGKGLSNFIIDKVLDLSSLFVLSLVFGFLFYKSLITANYWYLIIIIFAIMIIISLIFYNKKNSKPILKFIHRRFVPKKLKERSRELFDSFYQDMPSLKFLALVFLINLVNWIIDYVAIYFMALSLGIHIGYIPFLVVMIISTLVAQIPITINGLGTREITLISLFGLPLFGIESVKVFAMSVLNIIITNIIPSIFALVLLFGKEFKRERK